MAIDPTKFGLHKDVEVKFFTPEEAAKVNASSGYNAVYIIGNDRVRYELLKAGKTSKFNEVKQETKSDSVIKPSKATKQQKVVEVVEPKSDVVKEPKQQEISITIQEN